MDPRPAALILATHLDDLTEYVFESGRMVRDLLLRHNALDSVAFYSDLAQPAARVFGVVGASRHDEVPVPITIATDAYLLAHLQALRAGDGTEEYPPLEFAFGYAAMHGEGCGLTPLPDGRVIFNRRHCREL